MMEHIRGICRKAGEYGVRPVIHPHAGGYIEFADEIEALVRDIPYELAGLCLDTGHLYYSGMDPAEWLKKYAGRLDYVHFKDVCEKVYRDVLNKRIRFFEGCGEGAMCPIGRGCLDYPGIKKTLEEIRYSGYITVEHVLPGQWLQQMRAGVWIFGIPMSMQAWKACAGWKTVCVPQITGLFGWIMNRGGKMR